MMGIKVHMVTKKWGWNDPILPLTEWTLFKGKMKISNFIILGNINPESR